MLYLVILYLYLQIIDVAKEHLELVKDERCTYREVCKSARQNLKDIFTVNGTCQPPGPGSVVPPLSNNTVMHYSFDMAQQVRQMSTNNNIVIPVLLGALSIRSLSAWSRVLFDPQEMRYFWHLL